MENGTQQAKASSDKNLIVRAIIEDAISSLVAVGMNNENAVRLLVVQAVIRMRDGAEARSLLQQLAVDLT